eukprot:5075273-Amphidinium_carterae.1
MTEGPTGEGVTYGTTISRYLKQLLHAETSTCNRDHSLGVDLDCAALVPLTRYSHLPNHKLSDWQTYVTLLLALVSARCLPQTLRDKMVMLRSC